MHPGRVGLSGPMTPLSASKSSAAFVIPALERAIPPAAMGYGIHETFFAYCGRWKPRSRVARCHAEKCARETYRAALDSSAAVGQVRTPTAMTRHTGADMKTQTQPAHQGSARHRDMTHSRRPKRSSYRLDRRAVDNTKLGRRPQSNWRPVSVNSCPGMVDQTVGHGRASRKLHRDHPSQPAIFGTHISGTSRARASGSNAAAWDQRGACAAIRLGRGLYGKATTPGWGVH